MPTGNPIAVTLVEQVHYDRLCDAAFNSFVALPVGSVSGPMHVSATQYLRTLGMPLSGVPIIIVNGLDAPLLFPGSTYLKHCTQTHYPTASDLVGEFLDHPIVPNPSIMQPGKPGGSLKEEQIPGCRTHPLKPGSKLYGVGAYVFDGTSGVYDNDGSMAFTCDAAPGQILGIAWSIGNWGADKIGVTADLSAYNLSVQSFYDQTAGTQSVFSSSSGKVEIRAARGKYNYGGYWATGDLDLYPPIPGSPSDDQIYVIVSVRPT
jgi:hypothetical protein